MSHMRLYLSLLTLYENNCRQLHWKLAGKGFHTSHERFGGYYETLGTHMDETAEQMITLGESPVNIAEAIGIVRESDIDAFLIESDKEYCQCAANIAAAKMFDQLYELALKIVDDDDVPDDVEDVFIGHAKWYRIEGKYKLGRANMKPDKPEQHNEYHPENNPDDDDDDD